MTFDVSALLRSADPANNGRVAEPLRVDIKYRVVIQSQYSDRSVDGGDRNVYGGNCLNNAAQMSTEQVLFSNTDSVLGSVSRNAASSPSVIDAETITSSIYAVEGVRCAGSPPSLCAEPLDMDAGTPVTLRVRVALPHDSYRQLAVSQAFPIPLFDISALTWPNIDGSSRVSVTNSANICSGTALPALNRMCFLGGSHTVTKNNPTFAVTVADMSW